MYAIGIYYGAQRSEHNKVQLMKYEVPAAAVIDRDRHGFQFNGKTAFKFHEVSDSIEVAAETKEDLHNIITAEIFGVDGIDDAIRKHYPKMAAAMEKFAYWLDDDDSKDIQLDEWED